MHCTVPTAMASPMPTTVTATMAPAMTSAVAATVTSPVAPAMTSASSQHDFAPHQIAIGESFWLRSRLGNKHLGLFTQNSRWPVVSHETQLLIASFLSMNFDFAGGLIRIMILAGRIVL